MSRETLRVDLVLVSMLGDAPAGADGLLAIVEHFRRSSGRLGYVLSEDWIRRNAPGIEAETIGLSDIGTMHCKWSPDDTAVPFDWERGTLSLWKSRVDLPGTVLAGLTGRRLGEIVDHDRLPAQAEVSLFEDTDSWLRLACLGWTVTLAEAFKMIDGK